MVFTRFVEIGRVVLINDGKFKNKLAVIVDVIDMARVLVDCPSVGVPRMGLSYKDLVLTDFKIDIPVSARSGRVQRAFDAAGVADKWAETAWAKKIARTARRASLNDFERFVVHVTKMKRNRLVNAAYKKLKKEAK